jgi:hypothetical protein
MTAPDVPSPKITSMITIKVFKIDWTIITTLLGRIVSMPTKMAVAEFTIPEAKMETEVICMSETIFGRLKIVVAMKFAKAKDIKDKAKPRTISKMRPDINTLLISSVRFSVLHCAVHRVTAMLTLQFRKTEINAGAAKTIVYKP